MLLAYSVDTPIHINRSHLLALRVRVLCGWGLSDQLCRASFVSVCPVSLLMFPSKKTVSVSASNKLFTWTLSNVSLNFRTIRVLSSEKSFLSVQWNSANVAGYIQHELTCFDSFFLPASQTTQKYPSKLNYGQKHVSFLSSPQHCNHQAEFSVNEEKRDYS